MRALLILAALISAPLLEVAVFAWTGGAIGVWPTVGLTLLTAAIGLALLRRQGIETLMRARRRAERDEPPVTEAIEGLMLALGGLFLFVPGFVSDAIGFAMLTPPLRRAIALRLTPPHRTTAGGPLRGGRGPVIETDFTVVDADGAMDRTTDPR